MNVFKYLLRINGEKHPEVCAKLEQVKQKNGIALYIRQLIEQDLQEGPAQGIVKESFVETNTNKSIKRSSLADDDFGGGLA